MNIETNKYNLEDISSLSSPIDSFLEDHIIESQFYTICHGEVPIGFFAIHNNKLMTQFFITKDFRNIAQKTFKQIKEAYNLKSAFVPTCDEFFLSHAIDEYKKIQKQAYFFQDRESTNAKKNNSVDYRLATEQDSEKIKAVSGDFLDNIKDRIRAQQIYFGFIKHDL
ncbi:MAG: hypothetical protein FVQ80_14850 [Planctomycetes bacterium]|nr:hypothetical protein [Planctomycetota bacterium]